MEVWVVLDNRHDGDSLAERVAFPSREEAELTVLRLLKETGNEERPLTFEVAQLLRYEVDPYAN